jgi:hypothetical protein
VLASSLGLYYHIHCRYILYGLFTASLPTDFNVKKVHLRNQLCLWLVAFHFLSLFWELVVVVTVLVLISCHCAGISSSYNRACIMFLVFVPGISSRRDHACVTFLFIVPGISSSCDHAYIMFLVILLGISHCWLFFKFIFY